MTDASADVSLEWEIQGQKPHNKWALKQFLAVNWQAMLIFGDAHLLQCCHKVLVVQ